MRFCEKPFRFVYIESSGKIHLCPWMNSEPIGFIHDGLESVWHSETARKVRRSILDGSFSLCRKEICPKLMNNSLPDIPEQTLEEATLSFPDMFSLAYDFRCNLSCPSCRKQAIIKVEPQVQKLFDKIYEEISPHLNNAHTLSMSGHGDPFFSKDCMKILENMRPIHSDIKIMFETHGTCFTPTIWKRIQHLSKCDITMIVSIDSFNPNVYAKLRRDGNFLQLQKNLHFMSHLRQEGVINNLVSVMVVQDLNFMEIPSFVKTCFDFGFDRVQLENIYSWGTMDEKEYFSKDLLNPKHPQHEFFKEIRDEVLKDPRVLCYAGSTARIPVEFVITGQSRLAIMDISSTDVVNEHEGFSTLLAAVRNRDYIFVVDDKGRYKGMFAYQDVIGNSSNKQAISQKITTLCKDYRVIDATDIARIFSSAEQLSISKQPVFPVISTEGKLVAKLLVSF
jgi:MoaA/NifB/PqqE/SkfB family radical SAM enzyme